MSFSSRELYSESYGRGTPLVLLHGFGGSTYSWRFVAPILAKKYRVILLDLKGFGKSPKPQDHKYSVWDQAELVTDFIRNLGEPEVLLGGHSFGGGVALATALNLLEEKTIVLSKLVLCDSMAYPQALPGFIHLLTIPFWRSLGNLFLSNSIRVRIALTASYKDRNKITAEQIREYARPLFLAGANAALIATACQLTPEHGGDLYARYREITIPTLVIWGKDDAIVTLALGERLAGELPNSEWHVIKNCGHMPHEEQPDQTNELLIKFLNI